MGTRKANRRNTTLLFIDFRSGYDRMDRTVLFRLLRRKGILSESQLELLDWLLSENDTKYEPNPERQWNEHEIKGGPVARLPICLIPHT